MCRLTFSSCRTCPSVSIRFHLAVGVRICMSGRLSTAGPMRIKIPSSSLIPVGSTLRAKSIHQTHPRLHKIIIIITVFTYAAKVDTNNYLKPFIHVCTLLNEQTKEVHRRDDRDICADLWEAVYNLLGVEAKRTPQLFKSVGQRAQMAGKQLVIAEFPLVGRP